jgi:hypothetical protein
MASISGTRAQATPAAVAVRHGVPRIAGNVTAGPARASCVPVSHAPCAVRGKALLLICSGAANCRGLPYGGSGRFHGGSTGRQDHLGRFPRLRPRRGNCRQQPEPVALLPDE